MNASTAVFARRELLPEQLTEHLRERIVSGDLAPNQRLPEQTLSSEYRVSRAPLREALRVLATEGLVTIEPHRGARVSEINPEEARQHFPVRGALEALAARLAARRAKTHPGAVRQQLATIDRELEDMQGAAARGDVTTYYRAGAAFHEVVLAASDNAMLARQYELLKAHVRRYQAFMSRVSDALDSSLAEHRAIVDAIRAGDERRAGELAEAHVARLEGVFLSHEAEKQTSAPG